eukprot:790114_1
MNQDSHYFAQIFTVVFKIIAMVTYILGGVFNLEFRMTLIICVLMLAADFWAVKNVTGRLLVGLRWWNKVNDDGTTEWVFESAPPDWHGHPQDARVFWWSLYATPLLWLLLALSALFGFHFGWLILVLVAVVLSGSNAIGYFKCRKDAKKKIQQGLRDYVVSQLL